jgi:hypothetical protein
VSEENVKGEASNTLLCGGKRERDRFFLFLKLSRLCPRVLLIKVL